MTMLRGGYETRRPWPDDCFVQCGGSGLVIRPDGSTYGTAFFEALPKDPDTFIRGEGATVAEAEDAAWAKSERYAACSHSAGFDPRTYRNGLGFCRDCGMSKSDVIDPADVGCFCSVCGVATFWCEVEDVRFCKEHEPSRAEQQAMRAVAREAAIARGETPPFRLVDMFEALLDADEDEEDER